MAGLGGLGGVKPAHPALGGVLRGGPGDLPSPGNLDSHCSTEHLSGTPLWLLTLRPGLSLSGFMGRGDHHRATEKTLNPPEKYDSAGWSDGAWLQGELGCWEPVQTSSTRAGVQRAR